MKSIKKLLIILICIILATLTVACNTTTPTVKPSGPSAGDSGTNQTPGEDSNGGSNEGGSNEGGSNEGGSSTDPTPLPKPDPVPSYEDTRVAVLDKNNPAASVIVYAGGLADEAEHLQSVLTAVGIAGIDKADTVSFDVAYRIILGNVSCEATGAAKALYSKAKSGDDFVWAFAYADGDLAIYAESDIAYEKAISDLVSNNVNLGRLIIDKDFSATGVYTQAQYHAYLAQIESEKQNVALHEGQIDALLSLLEAQREELKTYMGKVSKYEANDPEILLFQQYRAHLGTPSAGRPTVKPNDEHPRLLITSDTIPEIQKSLRAGDAKAKQFQALVSKTLPNGGLLKELDPAGKTHNLDYTYLEVIQAKALASAVYGDDYYGYQAIYYMKNVLKSLDIQYITSDQCRDYGYVMFTAALVYDWCYDLLTEEDKIQFIAGVENCICEGKNKAGSKTEVGFPPSGGGAVVGHSCEYIILRDYLSFAIAIYGDNNAWWNYIGGRVYNEFIPVRNYYYQSDMTPQGTGTYVTARFGADIFTAWMLRTATGENPLANMEKVVRSCLSYEFSAKRLFNDGDGNGSYVDAFRYMDIAYMSAYLYGDTTLLAQGNFLLGTKTLSCGVHRKGYMGINNPLYMALSGLCDIQPKADRYEEMELLNYNGSPLGQYLAHSAWNDPSSVSVFMRIKERTTGNHEHADSGTFEIYYKGMLTSDGGIYDNNSSHGSFYHSATVSHNGLLIYDPAKKNSEGGLYSGGQIIGVGSSSNLDNWLADENMKTGTVTGRQHEYIGGDKSKPKYAYIAGDITAAYDSASAFYVGRRMLTVFTGDAEFPMVFFVFDDITSRQGCQRSFLLQITSKDAPTVNENDKTVTTENEGGRLVLTCLTTPSSGSLIFKGQGGRNSGSYNASLSQNYLINGKQCVPSSNSDDGHWGRVEIIYATPKASVTFMNVLYVTDKGNKNAASVVSIEDAIGLEGGVFEGRIVGLFASARDGADETLSCTTSGEGYLDYYVSGVAAGEWSVSVNGADYGTYTATEEGGLLTFTAPAGKITISPTS
ncbi:MAG: heparinase II/III family protein [Clostridia bacterium]|nr:heparinase II/III family protein [Clostridia bacterium]